MLPLSFLADFLVPHIPAIHTLSPHRHLCPAVVRRSPLRLPVARRTSATLRWDLESACRERKNATQGAAGKGESRARDENEDADEHDHDPAFGVE
jgi:hypothetical protein